MEAKIRIFQYQATWCHLKLKDARKESPLEPSIEVQPHQNHDFGFFDFRVFRDKFPFFEAIIFVAICARSHRKLIHLLQYLRSSFFYT